MAIEEVAARHQFAPLRRRDFRLFLTAVTVVSVGQFLQALAAPFLIKQLTDSNAWVGLAGFAVLFPSVLTTPVAGILADRLERRRLLFMAYLAQLVVTGAFALLYAMGHLTPWRIVGLLVLSGASAGFQWPPIQTMSAVLVPDEELIDAVRLVSISFTAGRAVGPAIAAVILAAAGPGVAFAGTLVCCVLGLATLLAVRQRAQAVREPERFLSQFRAGLGYVRRNPGLRLVMRLAFTTAMLGATFSFSLAPSVAADLFRTGGGGLGALAMMIGIGSAFGSVYISGAGGRVRRSRLTIGSIALYGTALLVVASSSLLAIGLLGFGLMGIAHMLHNVSLNTALQVQVEDEYRGRVLSVWLISLLSGLPLGAIIGGVIADLTSIRVVLVLFGGLLLANLVWTAIRTQGLSPLDDALPAYRP
jgi:MFS family permease